MGVNSFLSRRARQLRDRRKADLLWRVGERVADGIFSGDADSPRSHRDNHHVIRFHLPGYAQIQANVHVDDPDGRDMVLDVFTELASTVRQRVEDKELELYEDST